MIVGYLMNIWHNQSVLEVQLKGQSVLKIIGKVAKGIRIILLILHFLIIGVRLRKGIENYLHANIYVVQFIIRCFIVWVSRVVHLFLKIIIKDLQITSRKLL